MSSELFVLKIPGRLTYDFGSEGPNCRFRGGTIFNDSATGIIFVENQILLGSGETIMGKQRFGEWIWEKAYVEVYHYHDDNGIITEYIFHKDRDKRIQYQSFLVLENRIRMIMQSMQFSP